MTNNYTNTSTLRPESIQGITNNITKDLVLAHGPFHRCRCDRGTAISTQQRMAKCYPPLWRDFDLRSIFCTIPMYILFFARIGDKLVDHRQMKNRQLGDRASKSDTAARP